MKTYPTSKIVLALAAASALFTASAEALTRLQAGNSRFVANAPAHPHSGPARREETAAGQQPFAIVLGCADSRTGPELIFDQGIGDLFVARLAGNLADDAALGSIEFAVAKLGARLVVVLGHEKCGAVAAAVQGGAVPGHIGAVVSAIEPAVKKSAGQPGDALENAIRENVLAQVEKLKTGSDILAPMLRDGSLSVVGARYDLKSGKVTFYE